jgi:hypothetical protein
MGAHRGRPPGHGATHPGSPERQLTAAPRQQQRQRRKRSSLHPHPPLTARPTTRPSHPASCCPAHFASLTPAAVIGAELYLDGMAGVLASLTSRGARSAALMRTDASGTVLRQGWKPAKHVRALFTASALPSRGHSHAASRGTGAGARYSWVVAVPLDGFPCGARSDIRVIRR